MSVPSKTVVLNIWFRDNSPRSLIVEMCNHHSLDPQSVNIRKKWGGILFAVDCPTAQVDKVIERFKTFIIGNVNDNFSVMSR